MSTYHEPEARGDRSRMRWIVTAALVLAIVAVVIVVLAVAGGGGSGAPGY
ncbi:MAG: hypothetical protein ACJ74P_15440 [Gaiellaceae bacterium]